MLRAQSTSVWQNWQTGDVRRSQRYVYDRSWGSHLKRKRWEGKDNYKRGGRGGRRKRKQKQKLGSLFPFLFSPLPFLPFFIIHPLNHLSPMGPREQDFLDFPRNCKDYSSVNNNPLLDYKLWFPRQRFIFPQLWPDVQLRTTDQPHSDEQGKG